MTEIDWSTEDLIQLLLEHDLEQFYDNDDPGAMYAYLRRRGIKGYDNWEHEELIDEAIDRELIDPETLEII